MAEKGLNQRKLSDILDVKPSTVSRWVNGHDFPKETALPQIAQALDCSVDDLLKGPETPKTGPNLSDLTKADQILELLKNRLPADAERLKIEAQELKNLIGPHLHLLRQLEARPELVDAVYAAALIRHKSPSNLALKKKGS